MSDQSQKVTPIFSAAQKMGAQFVVAAGWQLANIFSSPETEVAAASRGVALADLSANGKITVEGDQAEAILQSTWSIPSLAIGQGAAAGPGHVYRLRADRFYITTPPGLEGEATQAVVDAQLAGKKNATARKLFTVTDITHGRSELLLIGPASAELLSRLCGLDFHPAAFPNLSAKQSSVAKTSQLVIHNDLASESGADSIMAFSLVGSCSLAAYLWDTLLEAGRDLDITPLGLAALEQI